MARHFLIAFVARSGSTAIGYDLRAHPQVQMRFEVFGNALLPEWAGSEEQTDDNRLGWLNQYWRGGKAGRVARGFKLQFNRGEPQFDDLSRLADAIRAMNPVLFRLRRDDRLRHAVSVLRANELVRLNKEFAGHDQGHAYADGPEQVRDYTGRATEIDIAQFERVMNSIAVNTSYLDGFMAQFPGAIDLSYEDYLRDRLAVLNRITDAIAVERFDAAPPSVVTKISNDDLRLAVSNYDELAAAAQRLGLAI